MKNSYRIKEIKGLFDSCNLKLFLITVFLNTKNIILELLENVFII